LQKPFSPALNLGACLSYAVARVAAVPLLFKGGDLSRTDIEPAWRP
jgi:ribonuclease VapC